MDASQIVKQNDTSDAYHIYQLVAANMMIRINRSHWICVTQNTTGSCLFRHPDDEEQTILVLVRPQADQVAEAEQIRTYLATAVQSLQKGIFSCK